MQYTLWLAIRKWCLATAESHLSQGYVHPLWISTPEKMLGRKAASLSTLIQRPGGKCCDSPDWGIWVSSGKGLCFMALTPSPGCLSWDTATTHRHRDREHSVPLEILPFHACSLNKYVCSKRIYMPKHTGYSWKQVLWFCCDSKLPRAVKRGNIPFSCKREMCMVWAKRRLKTKYQLNSNWHSSQRNQFHLKSFSLKTDQLS